ncbi:basic helix-loop-helix ARNT like 1b [Chaetodon trifascialis]|uniref:basic helix-loop-helix ARNT like 1b n=1 Tax=Chaetodon trifascialis TaxID=109706 RepID=UPI003991DD11
MDESMEVSSATRTFTSSQSIRRISSSTGTTSKSISLKRKGNSTGHPINHSLIQKRYRDKINSFIDELASLVLTCTTKSNKLDKLSILRMTVQHMKTLRGSAANCYTEVNHKPAFLSDEELKHLIQRVADSFLFVVDCDGGNILFVSESVHRILSYTQNDLIGQSLFDYLHPKDIAKVKKQLCMHFTGDISGPLVKTDIYPSSLRPCSGVRRSFFCRMKCNQKSEDGDSSFSYLKKNADHKGFCTVHSTGYLKNNELGNDGCNSSCLVAVGRLYPHTVSQPVQNHIKVKPMEFVSRHDIDGKFVFVDQRAAVILAYLPEELLGSSFYEYIHEDDIAHLAKCHRQVLQLREKINTNCYKMKIKGGSFITLRSRWFSFMNPWTKEVEYIVSTNTVVIESGQREGKRQTQDYSTTQEVATSAQVKQDAFEALETGQEV